MNRGLFGFLSFVALVVVAVIAGAIWLGPNGLAFVLHDERKTAPFVMVDLLDFVDANAEARYRQGYHDGAMALIEGLGGQMIWEGRLEGVLSGRLHDGWPVVAFVRYPSRAVYVDLVTSSEYRALARVRGASLARNAMLAGAQSIDLDPAGGAFVLRLSKGADAGWRSRYESEWQAEDGALLERHRGRIAWRATLNPIAADDAFAFDEAWLYAFRDERLRAAWANDPERRTVESLEARLFERDVVLLLRASFAGAGTRPESGSERTPKEMNRTELVELAEVRQRPGVAVGEVDESVDR
jgi:uncharacterized protein (DUF1330 family)